MLQLLSWNDGRVSGKPGSSWRFILGGSGVFVQAHHGCTLFVCSWELIMRKGLEEAALTQTSGAQLLLLFAVPWWIDTMAAATFIQVGNTSPGQQHLVCICTEQVSTPAVWMSASFQSCASNLGKWVKSNPGSRPDIKCMHCGCIAWIASPILFPEICCQEYTYHGTDCHLACPTGRKLAFPSLVPHTFYCSGGLYHVSIKVHIE